MIAEETEVEIVMRKIAPFRDYKKMILQAMAKGWTIKAYQVGVFSNKLSKEIKKK